MRILISYCCSIHIGKKAKGEHNYSLYAKKPTTEVFRN